MKILPMTETTETATEKMTSSANPFRGSLYQALANENIFAFNILCVFLFNAADAVFTSIWLRLGVAKEANPLMNWVYQSWGESTFIIVKIVVCTLALYVLWTLRERILTKLMIIPIMIVYTVVTGLHIWASFYL